MGILSLTAVTCAFFLLTSIGQMHQQQKGRAAPAASNDDFAEFDNEDFDGVTPQSNKRDEPEETVEHSRRLVAFKVTLF